MLFLIPHFTTGSISTLAIDIDVSHGTPTGTWDFPLWTGVGTNL